MQNINHVQELNLQLMEAASFNNFDGKKVVQDLRENKELWRGAVMGREGYAKAAYASTIDLISLRDIEDDCWNVSTIFILVDNDKAEAMVELAKTWSADEVDILDEKEAQSALGCGNSGRSVIRIWWD